MSQSKFASSIGRSRQYINKLVHKGIIPVYDGKKIKSDEAKRLIAEHEDPSRDSQREANEERRNSDLFEAAGSYPSLADLTEEEKHEIEKKRQELLSLKEEAESLGVDEELPTDFKKMKLTELNIAIRRQELRIKTAQANESEKKVVSIDHVTQSVYAATRVVRDGLQSIPARLAARLAAESNPHLCRTMLESEINRQLQNFTEVFSEQ